VLSLWTVGGTKIPTARGSKVAEAVKLPDGGRIQWRTESKSGAFTIDLDLPGGPLRKVHFKWEFHEKGRAGHPKPIDQRP